MSADAPTIIGEARAPYRAGLSVLPVTSDVAGQPDVRDAAKPARRSHDLPIADLLSELHLTAEAVRDITPDVLDGRLRALAAALDVRDQEPDKTADSTITLTDDEPAPEPVNGAMVLDETAALIRRHRAERIDSRVSSQSGGC